MNYTMELSQPVCDWLAFCFLHIHQSLAEACPQDGHGMSSWANGCHFFQEEFSGKGNNCDLITAGTCNFLGSRYTGLVKDIDWDTNIIHYRVQ